MGKTAIVEFDARFYRVQSTGARSAHWDDDLPSVRWHPQAITDALSKECEKGFMTGAFEESALHVSGLGVVTKEGTRGT